MLLDKNRKQLPLVEFIPLMALATGLDALAIDSLLPALPAMGRDLAVASANDMQLVVSAMFLGMAFGQMFGGPLSDGYGRRPIILGGLLIFMAGSIWGLMAVSFPAILGARVLQGFGASIPVVVLTALVRDLYEGAPMARIMSFIGTVFILVPILAPLAGQGLLLVAHWRMIFVLYLGLAVTASLWFLLRQPETLAREKRLPMSVARIGAAIAEVLGNGVARGYIIAGGLLFGAFLGYLNSAQQIFQTTYDAGVHFVLFFSTLAFSIGASLLINGTLVTRFGMQAMTYTGFAGLAGAAVLFLPFVLAMNGVPALWMTMAYLLASFLFVGILFGNLNALAMEPIGHIAGVGAAIVGVSQTLIGLPLGTLIGRAYDGTLLPLVAGFAILGGLGLLAMYRAESNRALAIERGSA